MTGLLGQCAGQQDQRKACRVGGRTEPLAAGNPASPATGPGRIPEMWELRYTDVEVDKFSLQGALFTPLPPEQPALAPLSQADRDLS